VVLARIAEGRHPAEVVQQKLGAVEPLLDLNDDASSTPTTSRE
jgi:hypothetical protein